MIIFLMVTLGPLSIWLIKEFIKDFPILFGKDYNEVSDERTN
jgi:hypothetical protein